MPPSNAGSYIAVSDGSSGWYTKTPPQFEVAPGPHDWLLRTGFVGDLLLPTRQDQVVVEVFEIV